MRRSLAGLLALAVSTACLNVTPPGVFLDTQPPGARIVVDGKDSGFVTPCLLALPRGHRHTVRLELPGHASREIELVPGERITYVPYYHAVSQTVHFPLFARTEDLFYPLRRDANLVPGRIHLRLHPERRPAESEGP